MDPLNITIITSITAMLLVSALLFLVRTMPSRPGIEWWISASIIECLVYIFCVFYAHDENSKEGLIIFYSLAMASSAFLNIGTLLFLKKTINVKKRLTFLGLFTVLVVSLVLAGQIFIASLLMSVFNAACSFQLAYKFFNINSTKFCFKFTAVLLAINGIHWLDYPIMSRVEWFVPIGFMLGIVLLAGIYINLAFFALLQFKKNTLDSEKRALEAATTDSLTGLYNRSHLSKLFNNYVKEAEQIERSFILLFFDLDGFKLINDKYGHKAGDVVLQTVSARLVEWLGHKGDAIRIGGDELVVLTGLRGTYDKKNAISAARHLLNCIERPIVDGDNTYQISASVGGCCYGYPLYGLDEMMSRADKLMYIAKKEGGGGIHFSHTNEVLVKSLDKAQFDKVKSEKDKHENKKQRKEDQKLNYDGHKLAG